MVIITIRTAAAAESVAIRQLRHIAYIIRKLIRCKVTPLHRGLGNLLSIPIALDHNMATRRVIGIGSIFLNPGCHRLHMLSLAYGGSLRNR